MTQDEFVAWINAGCVSSTLRNEKPTIDTEGTEVMGMGKKFGKAKPATKNDDDDNEETPKRGKARGKGGKAKAKRKSKYDGVQSSEDRSPMLSAGTYRLRVVDTEDLVNEGNGNESFKATFEVVESKGKEAQEEGSEGVAIFMTSGKGMHMGLSRIKAFMVAAAGFEDDEGFDEFDPYAEFIDACQGEDNDMRDAHPDGVNGRLVDCIVSKGNNVPDSDDYYRNFEWTMVEDDEQDD